MAITQSDIDRLDAAIVSGILEVEVDGQRRRYQHTDAMRSARDHAAALLSTEGSSATPNRGMVWRPTMTTARGG
jgi:hypothetical protein